MQVSWKLVTGYRRQTQIILVEQHYQLAVLPDLGCPVNVHMQEGGSALPLLETCHDVLVAKLVGRWEWAPKVITSLWE